MEIIPFAMERLQSHWENQVKYNLSESGVHPLTLQELLGDRAAELLDLPMGYIQTDGTPALKQAICNLYGCQPENILVTNGSAEANYLLLWSLLEQGDEVVVQRPNYMQVEGLARSYGANVKTFELEEDLGWQPDLDKLRQQIGPKTRLVSLSNPNNPTGAQLDPESRRTTLELCDSNDSWILADEVYQGAELDGELTPSLWGASDKVVVSSGLSKAYGLPGLRVGWIVGPADLVERVWPSHDYTTIAINALSDHIAPMVLSEPVRSRVLARTRRIIQDNLALMKSWLEAQGGLFSWTTPRAGAIAFPRYHLDVGSAALVERLRQHHDVLLVPGQHFDVEGHLRFGIGGPREELALALDAVAQGLRKPTG